MPELHPLLLMVLLLAGLLVWLAIERLRVDWGLGRFRVRVAVTGTRGKSSVTRLVAGALRESGLRVLAKTTGSAARIIWPDGSETDIVRPGPPSILEDKLLLRLARKHRAEALVCEMMSIKPECLRLEARRLLRPGWLVVTNVRLDHRDEQGATREEIARSLAAAIGRGMTVLVPEEDDFPAFATRAAACGARIVKVPSALPVETGRGETFPAAEFEDNVRLALSVAEGLGILRATALRGMAAASPDLGHLKTLRARLGSPPAEWTLVSAFAANEPDSSRRAMDKVLGAGPGRRGVMRAILNLRQDRGDRTGQWLDAIRDGFFDGFDGVALVGPGAVGSLRRRLRSFEGLKGVPGRLVVLRERNPEAITSLVSSWSVAGGKAPGGLIFGLGNMGGLGRELMAYWERLGPPAEKDRD